jgi:hypothetical protein
LVYQKLPSVACSFLELVPGFSKLLKPTKQTGNNKPQTRNNSFTAVKISIVLSAVLTPLVLIAVTYLVINSDFDGFFQMKWGRDGGEVLIDQRRPTLPNSEN